MSLNPTRTNWCFKKRFVASDFPAPGRPTTAMMMGIDIFRSIGLASPLAAHFFQPLLPPRLGLLTGFHSLWRLKLCLDFLHRFRRLVAALWAEAGLQDQRLEQLANLRRRAAAVDFVWHPGFVSLLLTEGALDDPLASSCAG